MAPMRKTMIQCCWIAGTRCGSLLKILSTDTAQPFPAGAPEIAETAKTNHGISVARTERLWKTILSRFVC
jgi:hypothetical protein